MTTRTLLNLTARTGCQWCSGAGLLKRTPLPEDPKLCACVQSSPVELCVLPEEDLAQGRALIREAAFPNLIHWAQHMNDRHGYGLDLDKLRQGLSEVSGLWKSPEQRVAFFDKIFTKPYAKQM